MKFEAFESTAGQYSIEQSFAICLQLWGPDRLNRIECISLQRAIDPDDDEDGLYVERGQQQYACYGGVESCHLAGNVITLNMSAEGAVALGGIKTWRFHLPVSSQTELPSILARMFRDCTGLIIEK